MLHSSQTNRTEKNLSQTYPAVSVPTATILLCASDDPYAVLVGSSSKHSGPVLPGGKIDSSDLLSARIEDAALNAAKRELREEVGCAVSNLRLLQVMNEPDTDIRVVPAGLLRETLVGDELRSLTDSDLVRAHYGVPDYLFVGSVERAAVSESSELFHLRFLDIRELTPDSLGAGHTLYTDLYLRSIEGH